MKGCKLKLLAMFCFGMAFFLRDAVSQVDDTFDLPEYDSQLMAAEQELAAAEEDLVKHLKFSGHKRKTIDVENKVAIAPKPSAKQSSKPTPEEQFIVNDRVLFNNNDLPRRQEERTHPVTSAKFDAKLSTGNAPASAEKSDLELLKTKLALKEKALVDLNSQLRKTKDRLMVAETEIDRLAVIVKTNNQDQLHSISPKAKLSSNVSTNPALPEKRIENVQKHSNIVPDRKVSDEMPIATVIVDKANLRTGPGDNNSPIMTIAKGARLAVETRSGEWYRIITPTGSRAWISGEVIRFGKDLKSAPTRTVEVKGYSRQEIDEAFELIKQHSS